MDCWIVLVTELDSLGVPVVFKEPETVPDELIVFDWLTEPDKVVEPVEVLELDELPENVAVAVCVLVCGADLVNDADPVFMAVWEGLLVKPGGPDLVAETDPVIECVREPRTVAETQEEVVDVLLWRLVRVEVGVIEEERVFLCIVTVGVNESLNEDVSFGELDERGLELDVLVDRKLRVLVLVWPTVRVWVGVALCVLEPTGDLDRVGEAEDVLLDVIVLVPLDDPDDVFVAVRVAVPVRVTRIVLVWRGDLDIEVDPVEVREPRAENVREGEADEVLDNAVVLELVGLDELVLDWVVVPVWVLEEVCVLELVVVPVIVLEDEEEPVNLDVEEDVFDKADVFVKAGVPFIVTEENRVGVGLNVGLDEYVDVVVFVDVLDIVPVELGTIPFTKSCLSILKSSKPMLSENVGGVEPTNPIVNSTKSHLIPIYYIGQSSFLGTSI